VEMEGDQQMTKAMLLSRMREERARWEAVLAEIGAECMTAPLLHDGWSVKDTIGHVAYYEKWLQQWVEAAVRGKVTVASHRDLLEVDQRNALIWQENKNRSLDEIITVSRYVYERLYELVRFLPERDLLDRYTYERFIVPFWKESQPLWKCIAGDSYEHYAEHTANVQRWIDAEQLKQSVGMELGRSGCLQAGAVG
jgi:uncharacterized damage-inducible protein DinB